MSCVFHYINAFKLFVTNEKMGDDLSKLTRLQLEMRRDDLLLRNPDDIRRGKGPSYTAYQAIMGEIGERYAAGERELDSLRRNIQHILGSG